MSDKYDELANDILYHSKVGYKLDITDIEILGPAVAAALREQGAALDRGKELLQSAMEVGEQRRLEIVRLKIHAGAWPEQDEDGACSRCGLSYDGEKDEQDEHVCPPGFWNKWENRIAELKAEAAGFRGIAERNYAASLMPCPQCGYKPGVILPLDYKT